MRLDSMPWAVFLVVTLSCLGMARPVSASDCAGGSVRRVSIAPHHARVVTTVTWPGASHENLISSMEGLHLRVRDPQDPSHVILQLDIPADRFISGKRSTRYDRSGDFRGRVHLRNRRKQADTVQIDVRFRGTFDARPDSVRVSLAGPASCSHTCVSDCAAARHGGLRCRRSALYVPFPDQGFGALRNPDAARVRIRSGLCGLAIETTGPRCDLLIDENCLLPYPSSVFLDEDKETPTGRRIHYDPGTLPVNDSGTPVDPDDWNSLDGFSPGPMILALFPDSGRPVDLDQSDVASHANFVRSLEPDHPTVLMRADDGVRILHFAELDARTDQTDKKALILRPGVRLDDATRYFVAIRHLVDSDGTAVQPRLAFRALRDGIADDEIAQACGSDCAAALAARREKLGDVFAQLELQGVARDDLLLAWQFTTASSQALTGWMVSIRDQAFALGTPGFTVDQVEDGGGAGVNAFIHTRIQGTFQAPLFMTADAPASRLNLVGGVPVQNGYASVPYVVDIPRVAVASENPAATPARGTLWGHGLLGNRFQLGTLAELGDTYNIVIAAVDMQGMSDADLFPSIFPLIQDFSLFHRIPERLHQGFLNHLLLGRLMNDPVHGFNSDPAFQLGAGGAGVFDTNQIFYSGGSQGGIFGGAIMAISQEFQRGFLAVPAANYSTLLRRSVDFNPFIAVMSRAYPDPLDQDLLFALIQQLWDRAEPQGYLPHLLPGTLSDPPTPHKVLLHMATYDSEVSNLATEIMLRSLGIPQVTPVLHSFHAIPEAAAPFDGSALVEIDPLRGFSRCHTPGTEDAGSGCRSDSECPGPGDPATRTVCASGVPPFGNEAPAFNNGAHGSTGTAAAGSQINAFLQNGGQILQTCTGPCDPE